MHGIKYSTFMHWLGKSEIQLDRRVLADMAIHDPGGFKALVHQVESAAAGK